MNEFNVVSLEQNGPRSLIVFEINNIRKLSQKTSVGQFVKSNNFELNFPISIGQSKWVVLLFLNGQYDHRGIPSEVTSVYLKMLDCDKQTMVFKFDIECQLRNGHSWNRDQSICFNIVNTRWFGTHLININEIIRNGEDDNLLLSIHLTEQLSEYVSAKTTKSYIFEAESTNYTAALSSSRTVQSYDFRSSRITENVPFEKEKMDKDSNETIIYLDAGENEEDTENAKSKMKRLLESWKLDILTDKLENFGFDFYSLQAIEPNDLAKIFHEDTFLGPVRKFSVLHKQWMNTLKSANTRSSTEATSILETSISEVYTTNNPEPSTSKGTCSLKRRNNDIIEFNLNVVLNNTEEGLELLSYYIKKKKFMPMHRKLLIKLIVDHLVGIKERTSDSKVGEITNQIPLIFPNEQKSNYSTKVGKSTIGLLITSYHNRLAAIAARKKKLTKWRCGEINENENENKNEVDYLTDETKNSIEWLKNHEHNGDDESSLGILNDHWNQCYQYRSEKMKHFKLSALLEEFPVLTKSYGFTLVNIDFGKKYRTNGLTTWNDFFEVNMETLIEMINDVDIRNGLMASAEYDDENSKNSQQALSLHGITIPASVMLKNKRWKPSIETSQDIFFQSAINFEDMKSKLKVILKNFDKKELEHHPMIFEIENDESNSTEYIVALNDIFYRFAKFIDAMDAAFKCYIFFNIKFPPQVIKFWTFINEIFYKIENHQLKATPTLNSIIQTLETSCN